MKWVVTVLTLAGLCSVSQAQLNPEDIIASASEQSARLSELAGLFEHPDPAVRYEAFRQLSASQDPLERNIAFQSALNSTDVDLRSLATVRRLEEMNPLVVMAFSGEAPTERFVNGILESNESTIVSLPQHTFDALRGTFVVGQLNNTPPSQVVGDEVVFAMTIDVRGTRANSVAVESGDSQGRRSVIHDDGW